MVPPQVPSHYAPNYPVGHPRRQTSASERGPGYSAVPMPPSQQIATHVHPSQTPVNLLKKIKTNQLSYDPSVFKHFLFNFHFRLI